jgi:hypothetical protein
MACIVSKYRIHGMLVPSIKFNLQVINKTVNTFIWKMTHESFNVLYN